MLCHEIKKKKHFNMQGLVLLDHYIFVLLTDFNSFVICIL